jgi:hypothetical protein
MKEASLRAIALLLTLSISLSVAAQPEWVVQTSSNTCVWSAPCLPAGTAERIEGILQAVENCWIPEPPPDGCTPPGTSLLSTYFGSRDVPLATVALYTEAEAMRRDLDRFDLEGLASPTLSLHTWSRPRGFLDRLPESAVIDSSSLLVVCCHPDGDWQRVAAHELVHALQQDQWDVDPAVLTAPYDMLLREGTARYTEYVLGYLDRFDLRTAGPVSVWLAEGGALHEAPEFLLYEIGASLVDALARRGPKNSLWSVLSGPCRSPIWNRSLGLSVGFDAAFSKTYGQSWAAFLDEWAGEAAAVLPPPGSECVYRWLRNAYRLRAILLAPLLDDEEIARIEAMEETVYLGTADADGFDAIDDTLRGAHGDPTPEVLEALHEREATLIDYARERARAFDEVAEVLRLGILARRGEAPASEYARAFIDVVNTYVPMAVQQRIADAPWWHRLANGSMNGACHHIQCIVIAEEVAHEHRDSLRRAAAQREHGDRPRVGGGCAEGRGSLGQAVQHRRTRDQGVSRVLRVRGIDG